MRGLVTAFPFVRPGLSQPEVFGHWRIPDTDVERPFANECKGAVNEVCSNSRFSSEGGDDRERPPETAAGSQPLATSQLQTLLGRPSQR
jgi:hypothetical protein